MEVDITCLKKFMPKTRVRRVHVVFVVIGCHGSTIGCHDSITVIIVEGVPWMGRVDGALLCLRLRKQDTFRHRPALSVAKELGRCMHEVRRYVYLRRI